ncbi:TRAF3 [Bugula neritina]|uniref:TRAF3 n=1 Tax=Bugula neritina TaxID=10212 RepID=A0A7J7KMK1_BUGNE|nr:TRAF3 [Bugula neritina]
MASALAGPSSMDVDHAQYQSISSTSFMTDDFNERPKFINAARLKKLYGCTICNDVVVQPHQTPCSNRVCKKCIEEKFGSLSVIKCPLPHDDMDEEELKEEQCQQEGLVRDAVVPDPGSQRFLLREKCFCENQEYGCCENPPWKKLKEHQAICVFVPDRCPNQGCYKLFAKKDLQRHTAECEFGIVKCNFCQQSFKQKDMEEHLGECDYADSECTICGTKFEKRKQYVSTDSPPKTNPECLRTAGKCYYFEYCHFESDKLNELKAHLKSTTSKHLEALTVRVHELENVSTKSKDMYTNDVKKAVNSKVKPLEKVTAEIAMKVKKLTDKVAQSETSGEHLVNAMRTVSHSSQQIETVQSKVSVIERQIKDSGLAPNTAYVSDRVTVIDSHSQNIRRHTDSIGELDKRVKNVELGSHDGVLVWKINDYKRRKSDAVRGRQMSIYSHPFYTSRHGYKMCCRAYLNGDGLGRAKCLSLFFVLMRGEYDELLHFPFKQRVTFSLLCPSNPSLSKHETFLPDPDSSSFRRPQTEMNIASGCPQFALHADVESSNFLINDCIYVRVRVEPGGDVIA